MGVPKAALDQSWRQIALVLGLLWAAATSAAFWIARRQHATAVLLYEDNRLLGERVAERAAEIQAKTRALTASEQKFSDAMACAPVAMGLFTAEGRILEVNAALCDLLGYAREELLSFEVARIFAPGEKPLDRAVIQRLAAGELKTYRSLRHYTHKDGRRIAAQVDTSVARTASGEVHYFISQGQDISARLAYEDRLKMLNVDLAERVEREVRARQSAQAKLAQNQKMAALGQLAGGVAHDFNTVLQTVLLGATSIRRLPDESEQSKSIAARIEAAASRGAAITGRLLSFARRNELSLEAVDVPSVLSELAEMLRPAFAPRVHLVVETAPDLPRTSTDRHQLEAALVNLATNAADAIVGEGRIVVAAREERALDGDVRRLEPGAYVRIDVRDDGAGMDEETLSHAFEPFFTTKEVGKGTGLGLPTARAFAEQSGGALTIASRPGEGTTASLWLPVAASPDASVTPLAPARLEAGRPLRVLLVDDEQPLVDRLAQDLRDHGFVVDVAETGAEALARLDAGAIYDVVVAELAMPRMDGVALLDEARLRVPDMPAVILTGNAVVAAQRIETLAVSLVRKPVSAAALAAAIAEAVHDRPRLTRSLSVLRRIAPPGRLQGFGGSRAAPASFRLIALGARPLYGADASRPAGAFWRLAASRPFFRGWCSNPSPHPEGVRALDHFDADVLIVGAGGAGLRAAIAAAEADPDLTIALVSKVLPMRSHTVAAEGGSAGVTQADGLARSPFPRHRGRRRLAVRAGRGRILRQPLHARDDPARALGLPLEPQAGRQPSTCAPSAA